MPNRSTPPGGECGARPPLRILHLEDDSTDAELIQIQLRRNSIDCRIVRVATRAAYEAALRRPAFDLILSDSSLPAFDGLSALVMALEKSPGTPFVFVTGHTSEEAVERALSQGATDYVFKGDFPRLMRVVQQIRGGAEGDANRQIV